eukprot:scaffold139976_cov130-Phaeocystis_antarctica.AAC.1
MSRRRGRRWPVPMHHQRVLGVQSSSSTAGRQNTGGSRMPKTYYAVRNVCSTRSAARGVFTALLPYFWPSQKHAPSHELLLTRATQ